MERLKKESSLISADRNVPNFLVLTKMKKKVRVSLIKVKTTTKEKSVKKLKPSPSLGRRSMEMFSEHLATQTYLHVLWVPDHSWSPCFSQF